MPQPQVGLLMNRHQKIAQMLFALGMISVGMLVLVYGYEVLLFSAPPPAWIPWLKGVGYASGIIMVGTGAGLLLDRTARVSIYVLLPFLLLWTLSRVPVAIADPGREISWFAIGEVAVLASAAWILFARLAELKPGSTLQPLVSEPALRIARILFGLSLVTYGLAHFFEFAAHTVSLVPPWLPFRTGWADLTGAGQIAAGLGVVLSIFPRLAAASEAAMLSIFTILVWVPAIITKPTESNWVEFLFTFALAGASWVVAESIPGKRLSTPDHQDSGPQHERTRASSLSA
jgi:uncharacterized membrane protein YphA (DoxX/SURF4 family)